MDGWKGRMGGWMDGRICFVKIAVQTLNTKYDLKLISELEGPGGQDKPVVKHP